MKQVLFALIFLGLIFSSAYFVVSAPQGVEIVSNSTETKNITPAVGITTAGGSFTTLVLNGTFQNDRWKAYVGNISGSLTLDDSTNQTIYDWDFAIVTGEVYASRSSSINWGNIACIGNSILGTEETVLNIDTDKVDSINNTFNKSIHSQFMVAGTTLTNSTCRAIATFVADSRQTVNEDADFQEILLDDNNVAVYATILENDAAGYASGKTFNFQMIVPDDETAGTDTTYYFYAELG